MNGTPACALHHAHGRVEPCPGSECPFWERGGAVVQPGCAFERLGVELESRPGIASWLLEIRTTLESARTVEERAAAHRAVQELLPPGLRE